MDEKRTPPTPLRDRFRQAHTPADGDWCWLCADPSPCAGIVLLDALETAEAELAGVVECDCYTLATEYDAVGLANGQRNPAALLRHIHNNHAATFGAQESLIRFVKEKRDSAEAELATARELIRVRCADHHLPLEYEPQGDAHYPLTGWYHRADTPTGEPYAVCVLTDSERAALPQEGADD